MKIHGIGVDIVKIGRIKKSLNNTKFKTRIFSIEEVNRCKKNVKQENCFAKKFAAKEAFSKALGTGISSGISFNEIVILNTKSGKPFIKLLGKTKKIVNSIFKGKKFNIFLSLSDDVPFAMAAVIISI
tara:strand:+ start:83 stop:466 length:384 start_codon:yes stop_codon:yes gene_type:complete